MVISVGMVDQTVFSPSFNCLLCGGETLVCASREAFDEGFGDKPRRR